LGISIVTGCQHVLYHLAASDFTAAGLVIITRTVWLNKSAEHHPKKTSGEGTQSSSDDVTILRE
jgi:hypothetical protein